MCEGSESSEFVCCGVTEMPGPGSYSCSCYTLPAVTGEGKQPCLLHTSWLNCLAEGHSLEFHQLLFLPQQMTMFCRWWCQQTQAVHSHPTTSRCQSRMNWKLGQYLVTNSCFNPSVLWGAWKKFRPGLQELGIWQYPAFCKQTRGLAASERIYPSLSMTRGGPENPDCPFGIKQCQNYSRTKKQNLGPDTAPLLLLHHRPGSVFRENAFKKKLLVGEKKKKGQGEEISLCPRSPLLSLQPAAQL